MELRVDPDDLPLDPTLAKAMVGEAYDPLKDAVFRSKKEERDELLEEARQAEAKAERCREKAEKCREEAKEGADTDLLETAREHELKAERAEDTAEEKRAKANEVMPDEREAIEAAKGRTKTRIRNDRPRFMQRLAVALKRLELEQRRVNNWAENLPGWARMRASMTAPDVKIAGHKCRTWHAIWRRLDDLGADVEAAEEEAREELGQTTQSA